MDEEKLISILQQCNSEDNELRAAGEEARLQLLNSDPNTFIATLLNCILSDNYKILRNYMFVLLISIFKHMKHIISIETLLNFYNFLNSNMSQLLNSALFDDLEKSWTCELFSYVIAYIHQLNEANDFDFNALINEFSSHIQPQFYLSIISQALDLSPDFCNIDLNLLLSIIAANSSCTKDIIQLYFSIIAKLSDDEVCKSLFPQILEIISNSDLTASFAVICRFCEKNAGFLQYIIVDLARFVSNVILNMDNEQTIITGIFVFSDAVINNPEICIKSFEFIDIFCDTFITIINHIDYIEDADESSNSIYSIAMSVINPIIEIIFCSMGPKILSLVKTVTENTEYLYGFLMFLGESINCFTSETTQELKQLILSVIEEDLSDNLRYAVMKIFSRISSTLLEDPRFFEYLVSGINDKEDERIMNLALIALKNLISIALKSFHSINRIIYGQSIEEVLLQVQEIILNAFNFAQTEKVVGNLIGVLSEIFNNRIDELDAEEVLGLYEQFYNQYNSSPVVISKILEVLPKIFMNFKKNNGELVNAKASQFFHACLAAYDSQNLDPQTQYVYMNSLLKMLDYVDSDIDESLGFLYHGCMNLLSEEIEPKEVDKNEVVDPVVFYTLINIKDGTKYVIEKAASDGLCETMDNLNKIIKKDIAEAILVANNFQEYNNFVQFYLRYLFSEKYLENFFSHSFKGMVNLLKRMRSVEGAEECVNQLKNIISDAIHYQKDVHNTTIEFYRIIKTTCKFVQLEKGFILEKENLFDDILDILYKSIRFQYDLYNNMSANEDDSIDYYTYFAKNMKDEESKDFIKLLGKISRERVEPWFREKIFPLILQTIDCELSINVELLFSFILLDPECNIFLELREMVYKFMNIFYQHMEEEDSNYAESELYKKYRNNGSLQKIAIPFFANLCDFVLSYNQNQEIILDLVEHLKDLTFNTIPDILDGTDLPNVFMIIFAKYSSYFTEDDLKENIDFITEQFIINFNLDFYGSYGWACLYLLSDWLLKYQEIFFEDYQQASAVNESTIVENFLTRIVQDESFKYKLSFEYIKVMKRFIQVSHKFPWVLDVMKRFYKNAQEQNKFSYQVNADQVSNFIGKYNYYCQEMINEHNKQAQNQ
ncbi:hypothetical protein TVAG_281560 [Trichomonas vaginalis G3]|uniref:Importin N-terminal domain-containing protein n=1 Tax=Trichomonas vaginalis (strain ATCC PRA-98 / G3) TaxID=412133 RepID=A2F980_TRIV3|nr:armadillo (ARM) repeat-containing protein family [Trichomonas vaginalis G3]EAX98558.1 hypothetical protein TVAG_281560 [Trichomonas vaginalis G3]KAI5553057.1 armadillo (ARM) repeat-containing protein family [Trichomonas vaginalis G3]|eukprot:XP_001311488.1 hypothetical protein [Trichomonas vaginalis G3]